MTKLTSIRIILKPIFILTFYSMFLSAVFAQDQAISENSNAIFILDNSGSMAEIFNGNTKLNTAKQAIRKALENSEFDSINMGLLEIGGECEVKNLVEPKINNHQAIIAAMNNVRPSPYLKAATPVAKSIYEASKILENYPGEKRIILVSDGGANCQGEGPNDFPLSACETVANLNNQGISFSLDLIGYGIDSDREFQCIAGLSDNYSYTYTRNIEDIPVIINRKVPKMSEKSRNLNLIDKITKFLTGLEGLIAATLAITAIFWASNKKSSSNNDNAEKW